jgi:hypothetical protein
MDNNEKTKHLINSIKQLELLIKDIIGINNEKLNSVYLKQHIDNINLEKNRLIEYEPKLEKFIIELYELILFIISLYNISLYNKENINKSSIRELESNIRKLDRYNNSYIKNIKEQLSSLLENLKNNIYEEERKAREEQERLEQERKAREEQERLEQERKAREEQERLEQERKAREQQERLEQERKAREERETITNIDNLKKQYNKIGFLTKNIDTKIKSIIVNKSDIQLSKLKSSYINTFSSILDKDIKGEINRLFTETITLTSDELKKSILKKINIVTKKVIVKYIIFINEYLKAINKAHIHKKYMDVIIRLKNRITEITTIGNSFLYRPSIQLLIREHNVINNILRIISLDIKDTKLYPEHIQNNILDIVSNINKINELHNMKGGLLKKNKTKKERKHKKLNKTRKHRKHKKHNKTKKERKHRKHKKHNKTKKERKHRKHKKHNKTKKERKHRKHKKHNKTKKHKLN